MVSRGPDRRRFTSEQVFEIAQEHWIEKCGSNVEDSHYVCCKCGRRFHGSDEHEAQVNWAIHVVRDTR